jgi:hypothetical protein
MLVDLVLRSCYSGLQPAVANALARLRAAKHSVMLQRSWQVGLQLEVAKRIITPSRGEASGCRSCRRASWEAEEVAQQRSSFVRSFIHSFIH